MLHLLYVLAFTVVAFFAVSSLIRSLAIVGAEATSDRRRRSSNSPVGGTRRAMATVPHPEMMDERGQPIEEPLLVMKSVSVEDARARLDAIYRDSPSGSDIEE